MQVKFELYDYVSLVSLPTTCYKLMHFNIVDCHMYSCIVCNIFMQFKDPFQLRMNVSAILITLVVALLGISIPNALSEHIDPDSFQVGDCAEAHYTAAPTGRTTVNLKASNGDVLLHVDYRVSWGSPLVTNTIVLNSQTGGSWGTEQRVPDITSTAGTVLEFLICAEANDFTIILNGKQVATYQYRISGEVASIEYVNSGYDSILKKLCVVYS